MQNLPVRDWIRHEICVHLANWDATVVLSGPTGSVDLCKSRYTMVAKTQTRVSGVFKPPFRDLVTLRTGFVWPRLLFSLECSLLFVFPPRSALRSAARSQSLFRVSIGARMMNLYRRHVIKEKIVPVSSVPVWLLRRRRSLMSTVEY